MSRRDLLWPLSLLALSCHCQSELAAAEGGIVAPSVVDFGVVPTGSIAEQTFTILNDGVAPVLLLTEIAPGDTNFGVSAVAGSRLPSGNSVSVTARFGPTQDGAHRSVVTYTTDAPEAPLIQVVLEGTATSAPIGLTSCGSLSARPATVVFGTVPLQARATRMVIVTNEGSEACTLLSAEVTGDRAPAEFSLLTAPAWPAPLAPTESVSIGLAFAPTSPAAPLSRQGTLTLGTADVAKPKFSVDLLGRVQNPAYARSAWPKWHADNANTGLSYVDTSGNRGQVAWTQPLGAPMSGGRDPVATVQSPVVGLDAASRHDRVYQLGGDGRLLAIDAPAGTLLWQAALSPPAALAQESTPTLLADGSMFVSTGGEQRGLLQFYHVGADGSVLWSMMQDDGFDTCPGLGPDGTLYLFDDDTPGVEAYVTTPGSGAPTFLWAATASLPTDTYGNPMSHVETFSAALSDDGQSLFTWGGLALAFSAVGQEEWYRELGGGRITIGRGLGRNPCGNESKGSPAVQGALAAVAFGAFDTSCATLVGGLAGLDLATGEIRWTGNFADNPASALPAAYLTRRGSALLGYSSPALLGDGGFVLGYLDGVYAFDPPASGQGSATVRWKFPTGLVLSSPAVGADGTVYVGSSDGNLYALDGPTGRLRWKFSAGAPINSSPAIGSDGSIYFAADNATLYALR